MSDLEDFESSGIPPPLSLSAPELSAESPTINNLIKSASSTDLLYERSMLRFYREAILEEEELKKLKDKKENADKNEEKLTNVPKIQINSIDREELVGLERKHSLRRRISAGGTLPQQILWTQRRHSLRNSEDLNDISEGKLQKFPPIVSKREGNFTRQKSIDEPRYKDHVNKRTLTPNSSVEIVEEEAEELDSSDNKYKNIIRLETFLLDKNDEKSNQPIVNNIERDRFKTEEPFEILTKKNKLPDPNFVPKPILKKKEGDEGDKLDALNALYGQDSKVLDPNYFERGRSKSFAVANLWTTSGAKQRLTPISLDTDPYLRQRSNSLTPDPLPPVNLPDRRGSLTSAIEDLAANTLNRPSINLPERKGSLATSAVSGISAIAGITGLAAASIVIPKALTDTKKNEEEKKVVADHYGDIVRNFDQRRKSSGSLSYTQNKSNENVHNLVSDKINDNYCISKSPVRQSSFSSPLGSPSNSRRFSNCNVQKATGVSPRTPSPAPISSFNITRPVSSSTMMNQSANVYTSNFSPSPLLPNSSWAERKKSNSPEEKSTSSISDGSTLSEEEEFKRRVMQGITVQNDQIPPTARRPLELRSESRSQSLSPTRIQQSSPSPQNKFDSRRRSTPSPMRSTGVQVNCSPQDTRESSLPPFSSRRHPRLREIMTQTSTSVDPFQSRRSMTPEQKELTAKAEVKVRSVLDYLTDLAMFAVACWLYCFSNELFAVPVLLVMVYRQLDEAVRKKLPKWMLRKSD